MQRLPHAHEDDVEAGLEHVELAHEHAHLAGDLAGGQVADDPHLPGQAEAAFHGAADLRRQAERVGRRVGNEHRLDQLPVLEPHQQLRRAVDRTLLADDFGRDDAKRRGEAGAQIAAEVGHAGEIGDAALVDPLEELARMKTRMAHRLERLLELGEIHLGEIVT